MARAERLQLKDVRPSKSTSSTAIRQLLVLVLTIIMGMLISVSCNAQKTSEKRKLPYKTKNRARANHYAEVIVPVDRSALVSNILEKQIIKEMVAQNLREKNDSAPIQLAPLVFGIQKDKLTAVDINPILIAIEFGRQGRTILMEGFACKDVPMHHRLSYENVKEVKSLMHQMGVPAERISIVACHDLQDKQIPAARIDFTAI
jgi:hypothetical protein